MKDDVHQYVEEFMYATCPECSKRIIVNSGRFKTHKKDNGLKCPYSRILIQGWKYRSQMAMLELVRKGR